METARPPGALRRRLQVSASTLSRLADTALIAVFLVVVSGAVVRLTDSGLGCDGWPDCSESVLPEREFHATIEFVNRVVALIGIILTLVTAVAAHSVRRARPRLFRAAVLAAAGMIAQIPLGGLTVLLDLHPLAVMAHFLLALIVLGVAVYVALDARRNASTKVESHVEGVWSRRATTLTIALVPLAALLVVTGAFVTAAGPHPGGDDIRRLGDFWTSLEVHVWITGSFGIGFAGLVVCLWLARQEVRGAAWLAACVLVVLVAQMAVGEVQRNNGLPWELVLAHVAMGSAIWAGMVGVAVRLVQRVGWPEREWLRGQYTLRHR
jgi:cytochrome c oxidase assembly protein subunit 15